MAGSQRRPYLGAMTPSSRRVARPERPVGIEIRHARSCGIYSGVDCTCAPAFRAIVHSKRDGRKIQKTFPTLSAAQLWRQDALVDLRRGALRAPKPATVRQVGDKWLADAKGGLVRNRSGDRYKPSVLRGYEQALRDYIYPDLGGARLAELSRNDVQDLADRLSEGDLSASTIRNALLPLRAICRRAYARGEVLVNPTRGLELPAVRGRRDRVAEPREARELIAALEPRDRPLWATAMYGGLRRGELRALKWNDVDLATGVIHVRRTWDRVVGELPPKSDAGRRKIPIPSVLRDHLIGSYARDSEEFAFGRVDGRPFEPSSVSDRAKRAWKRAKLQAITLHECRHTFASLMIAAGVNPKALQTFMGHASITVTLDLYGHLFPGSEDEAAVLLNAYLQRAYAQGRAAAARDRGENVGKPAPA
jgi:integrase